MIRNFYFIRNNVDKSVVIFVIVFLVIASSTLKTLARELTQEELCIKKTYLQEFEKLKQMNTTIANSIAGKVLLNGDLTQIDKFYNNNEDIRKNCGRKLTNGQISPEIFYESDYLTDESLISKELAIKTLIRSAVDGNIDATKTLAEIYEMGNGVPKDQKISQSYARKAAESGDAEGQRLLGTLYWRSGDKSSKNRINQYMWFNLAATKIKEASIDRDAVAKGMSLEEINEAQSRSTNCYNNKFLNCEK